MLCLYWLKNIDSHTLDGFAGIYKTYSQDKFHIILNMLLQIMRSVMIWKVAHMTKRDLYCCFVNYAQIP